METIEEKIQKLRSKKEQLRQGGDKKVQDELHKQGMLAARERLSLLLDPGSFTELDIFVTHHCASFDLPQREIPAEGVITGYGEIEGRPVFVYSQDFSAMSGTLGKWTAKKICKAMDMAAARGAPIIGINHSLGARLQEMGRGELGSAVGFGEIFYRTSIYSGLVPQISVMLGDNAGGQVYGPGLTDFIFATKNSNMFIAGPALVRSVIHEDISSQELGGAKMHASVSGAVHVLADDEQECLKKIRELLSFLPLNCHDELPVKTSGDDPDRLCFGIEKILPESDTQPFDMHLVINKIVDEGSFFEIHSKYAQNLIVGFARFAGFPVGIVATNSMIGGGAIDVKGAEKAARFVRFCDAFNLPLVYLQDNPAYMVGSHQERAGMIYRGAKLIYATSEATVPKITVIIRKGLAGAWLAMGSHTLGADLVYAWPTADMCGLHPKSIVDVIYRNEIKKASNPEEFRELKIKECAEELSDIYAAASWQNVNDIIEPAETRIAIVNGLKMTRNKRQNLPGKKHGNIPL